MNDPKITSDILQEIKKSLNFIYGIRCDYIDDELSKMERCKGKLPLIVTIRRVIFNAPATIVFWLDGSKTVVKAQNGEPFDKEKGLAMAICKKLSGNRGAYYDIFKGWCHEEAAGEGGAQG
mgnify:CR=1 FL=1